MDEFTAERVYLPTRNAAFRLICDEVVIVDTENNRMMTLNETGSAIWTMLGDKSIGEIAALLTDTFRVDAEQALEDVRSFLAELTRRGLVAAREGEKD